MRLWILLGLLALGGLYYWREANVSKKLETPEVRLIPREEIFGNPDRLEPRLSPDGRYLAYRAPFEGVLNVWVQDLEAGTKPEPYTFEKGHGVKGFTWSFQEEGSLIYAKDEAGDENSRLYYLDIKTRKSTLLTPGAKVKAMVAKIHHAKPDTLVVFQNDRDPRYFDLVEINLKTKTKKRTFENNEFAGLTLDDDFNLRFGEKRTAGGECEHHLKTKKGWALYRSMKAEDLLTTHLLGFNKEGTHTYWLDSTVSDRASLVRMDLVTKSMETLFEPKRGEVSGVFTHPTRKTILAVLEDYQKPEWHILDASVQEHFDYLKTLESGVFDIVSTSVDFKKWVVAYQSDTGMPQYYVYTPKTKKITYLFSAKESLEQYRLSSVHPIEITARDGLTMVAYLTLPVGSGSKNKGVPKAPLPMVLFVHGGPHARDCWGFRGMRQFLANRGYAVLQVNYRGSTGFGKKFLNAGNGEWGAKMHDDLIDAVNWAIKKKVADPKKIGILGGSYGGYATLVGLTFTPEVFACGVDIVGISNLVTCSKSIPAYWKPLIEEWKLQIGADFETEEGRAFLKSRSPLTFVDRIQKPLLIGQGANDPRVVKAESDQIANAMKKRGIPVTYILFPDEGHGFARPENRLAFYGITEKFLAENLGGAF